VGLQTGYVTESEVVVLAAGWCRTVGLPNLVRRAIILEELKIKNKMNQSEKFARA
jgi:hypothetical protein